MEALSLNLRLLQISGIVEPPSVSKSGWKHVIFSMYMTTAVIIFIPILVGELLAFYHFWGDLVVITNNMFTIVGNITFFWEALYIIVRRGAFNRLVATLQRMLKDMPRWNLKQQTIAKNSIKRGRRLTWFMVIIVYMVPFSWSIAPLIGMLLPENEEEIQSVPEDEVEDFWKSLISIMWLPLDATKSPVKEIIYTCQFMIFILTASYYSSVNTVFVTFIVNLTGQLETLTATVEDMDQIIDQYDDKELHNVFVDIIRHHQSIIDFSQELNAVMSPLLFFYFFSTQVMMCVMAFQMVLTWGEQSNFVKFFFGLLCVLAGPFFFCWQGNILTEQSVQAEKAVYNCQWYERSQRFKKMVLTVIMRGQKPIALTAGSLYVLSLDTFAKMLNSVYYYFAVLKQLHEE
ncbi:Odorant receptor 34 [Blattella germanica]|nr:Odorant receptor 34 [Blattella germanica]